MPNCYYYDKQRNRCNCYVNENLNELLAENAKLVDVLHEVETEAVYAYRCLQQDCITTADGESDSFTAIAYECKFTVESTGNTGGDWERNIGGMHEQKRVTFEGYATQELYAAIIGAIGKTVGGEVDA